MGRPPLKTPELQGPDFVTETPAEAEDEIRLVRAYDQASEAFTQEHELVHQIMGQIQAMDAVGKVVTVTKIMKLAYIKENKLYRHLRVDGQEKDPEKSGTVPEKRAATWAHFCEANGLSARYVDEQIANVQVFGEEAADAMLKMGIGYRDMRRFRALPDDERTALVEVAQNGDRDAFIDLAEAVMLKHAKEKEAAAKEKAELVAGLQAKDKRIEVMRERMNRAEDDADKFRAKLRGDAADPDAAMADLEARIGMERARIEVAINGPLSNLVAELRERAATVGANRDEIASAAFFQIERTLAEARENLGVKVRPDGDIMHPAWRATLESLDAEQDESTDTARH